MLINDLFKVACSSLYISSSDVPNLYWTDPQSTDKESQSIQEDRIQAIWTNSISIRLPDPNLGLGHRGQAATATILLSQFHQHLWGNPKVV